MQKKAGRWFAKKFIVFLGVMSLMIGVSACGKEEAEQPDTQEEVMVEETTQPTEEVQQPEVEAEVETEVEAESTEEVTEPVEETTPEEPQVEMVDFETWAKQADNDEVCLVVWNEELGVQEIMPTLQETKKSYQIQDGDKFAIPYNEKIIDVSINKETAIFPNAEYLEVSLPKGEISQVTIIFENKEGENETINYTFK